jgi:hypothetical protein
MVSQRVAGVPPVVATGEPEGWELVMSAYLRGCLKRVTGSVAV